MLKRLFSLSNGALLVALSLSTIAAWYSIIGLTAIFAGAVMPIIIMGTALEFAKITTTVWLRKYWYRCSLVMKVYLVPAVVLLALLTSMGIFGFLSKAHLDQNIGSGDVQAQVSLLDEKIAIQRETIKSSKAMLAQMDMQVNDIMTKGDSEKSVERSVVIRKQQAKERASLQKDIEVANKEIQKLNEERAPIASELRKVEAEVGPIKYIAALIYGDNPDANVLERAVRWVIILLVVVFDPLAIMLVLAANQSKEWDENIDKELELKEEVEHEKVVADIEAERPVIVEVPEPEDLTEVNHQLAEAAVVEEPFVEEVKVEEEGPVADKHPYLNQPFAHFTDTKPIVPEKVEEPKVEVPEEVLHTYDDERLVTNHDKKILAMGVDVVERPGDYLSDLPEIIDVRVKQPEPEFEGVKVNGEWVQTGPALEIKKPVITGDYIEYDNRYMHKDVFAMQYPDLFLQEDGLRSSSTSFGIDFPTKSNTGDIFVRVDVYPNRVYKYNGIRWIETSRDTSDTHLSPEYLEFLISKLASGEYDPELLTQNEQEAIADYIKSKKG